MIFEWGGWDRSFSHYSIPHPSNWTSYHHTTPHHTTNPCSKVIVITRGCWIVDDDEEERACRKSFKEPNLSTRLALVMKPRISEKLGKTNKKWTCISQRNRNSYVLSTTTSDHYVLNEWPTNVTHISTCKKVNAYVCISTSLTNLFHEEVEIFGNVFASSF